MLTSVPFDGAYVIVAVWPDTTLLNVYVVLPSCSDPLYSTVLSATETVTSLAVISSFPSVLLTVNCAVTSLSAASLTTAVPVIAFVRSHTSVLEGSLVVSPLTV